MRVTSSAKDARVDKYFSRQVRSTRRALCLFVSVILLACSIGCGSSPSHGDGSQNSPDSASSSVPELTDEVIHERINDVRIWDVPEENGTAEPISWRFDEEEPKEITVVEKQVEGDRATIILDIKTQSSPRARQLRSRPRYLAGQIRTKWALKTGWVLRRWEIVATENISMKYKDLPIPPAQP